MSNNPFEDLAKNLELINQRSGTHFRRLVDLSEEIDQFFSSPTQCNFSNQPKSFHKRSARTMQYETCSMRFSGRCFNRMQIGI